MVCSFGSWRKFISIVYDLKMFILDYFGSKILITILVISVPILLFVYIVKKFQFIGRVWQLPTFGSHHFLVGHLLTIWKNRDDLSGLAMSVCRQWREKGFLILWMSYYPVVGIFSWRHTEKIVGNKKFLDRGWPSRKLDHGFVSLISLANSEWRARRNMVAPSFGSSVLQDFIPTILHHVGLMLNEFEATNGAIVLARPIVQKHVASITLETSFGFKHRDDGRLKNEVTRSVVNFINSQLDRILRLYTWNDQLLRVYNWFHGIVDEREDLKKYIRQIIQARLAERNEDISEKRIDHDSKTKAGNQAFLDHWLDNFIDKSSVRNEDIESLIGELVVIAWASIETIANSTTWFLYNMAHNPDIQEKLYEELLDFDEKNENMTISQLNQLAYLNQCVLENLRLHPPSANAVRMVDEDVILDGHLIPKGILSVTFIYGIHHDEVVYPDPDKFDPSRFEPDNFAKIPSGAFIPFGDGPRRCIGDRLAILESKIIFSNIIKKFRIELVDRDRVEVDFDLAIRSRRPLKFKFISRSKMIRI